MAIERMKQPAGLRDLRLVVKWLSGRVNEWRSE